MLPPQAAAAPGANPAPPVAGIPLPPNKVVPSKQNFFEYTSWAAKAYTQAQAEQSFVGWAVFIPKALVGGLGDLFVNLAKFIVNTAHQIKVFLVGEMPDVSKYSLSSFKPLPLAAKPSSSEKRLPHAASPQASGPPPEVEGRLATLQRHVEKSVVVVTQTIGKARAQLIDDTKKISPEMGLATTASIAALATAALGPFGALALGAVVYFSPTPPKSN